MSKIVDHFGHFGYISHPPWLRACIAAFNFLLLHTFWSMYYLYVAYMNIMYEYQSYFLLKRNLSNCVINNYFQLVLSDRFVSCFSCLILSFLSYLILSYFCITGWLSNWWPCFGKGSQPVPLVSFCGKASYRWRGNIYHRRTWWLQTDTTQV